MRKSIPLLFILALSLTLSKGLKAQLDDGKLAPFWEVTDLNGDDWSLEDFLDEGKHVILDFSATWCGICWNYHQTEILDDLNQEFGPSGSDELQVFMFEASWNTNDACCYGQSGCSYISQGNWTNVLYPVVNLEDDELDLLDAYQISYFPTLYIINGDHQTIWEIGQASYDTWEEMITESFSLEVFIELTPGTCDMGEMTVSATGGKGDLSYKWSTGEETTTITAPSGYYDVTVEDENGYFVQVLDIELENDPDEFFIDDEEIVDVGCFGDNDGSIMVEIESSGLVEYEWFNGSDGIFVENLAAGTYELTVTNPQNDCVEIFEFEIDEPDAVILDFVIDQTTCGENNGIININATGGSGGFMYNFGNGFSENSEANDLAAGDYSVLISDENDCFYPLNFTIDSSAALSVQFEGNNILTCENQTSSIIATPIFADGLTYLWFNQEGDTLSQDSVLQTSMSGIYYMHVLDTLTGCELIDSIVIIENIGPPDIELTDLQVLSCIVDSFKVGYVINDTTDISAIWSYTIDGIYTELISDEIVISKTGFYLLTVVNENNGCSTELEFEVVAFYDFPTAFFSTEVNGGEVNVYPSLFGKNLSESWSLNDMDITMTDNYQLMFTENGVYQLCLSVQNECGENEYCDTLNIDGLVLVDELIDDGFHALIIGEELIINSVYCTSPETPINIYSISGHVMHRSFLFFTNGTGTLNLEHLPSGILFIELIDENRRFIQSVFKKQ